MIIGVDDGIIAFFSAQKLNGSVGNDLVGVHIGRGTGTALNGVYNKLTVQLSGYDFITGADNGLTDLLIKNMGSHIGHGCGLFDPGQIVDKSRMKRASCNIEIMFCPKTLHTVICFCRNLHSTDGICFQTSQHK